MILKPPSISTGDSANNSVKNINNNGDGNSKAKQRLRKHHAAVEYISAVQAQLSGQAFDHFMQIMMRFKRKELTRRGVVAEIDIFFSDIGFPDLISGFSVFLPPGLTVDMVRESNSTVSHGVNDKWDMESLVSNSSTDANMFYTGGAGAGSVARDVMFSYSGGVGYIAPSAEPYERHHGGDIDTALYDSKDKQQGELDTAINIPFLEKVKARFAASGNEQKYQELLDTIQECRTIPSSFPSIIGTDRLKILFSDQHPSLLAEFEAILPFICLGPTPLHYQQLLLQQHAQQQPVQRQPKQPPPTIQRKLQEEEFRMIKTPRSVMECEKMTPTLSVPLNEPADAAVVAGGSENGNGTPADDLDNELNLKVEKKKKVEDKRPVTEVMDVHNEYTPLLPSQPQQQSPSETVVVVASDDVELERGEAIHSRAGNEKSGVVIAVQVLGAVFVASYVATLAFYVWFNFVGVIGV